MNEYDVFDINYISDKDRFVIPTFQRPLVWTKAKKSALISTLHKGFPFGVLLAYSKEKNNRGKLLLLDGQQRLSTIMDYEKNKSSYWIDLNRSEFLHELEIINDIVGKYQQYNHNKKSKKKISKTFFERLLSTKFDLGSWTDQYEYKELNFETANQIKKKLRDIVLKIRGQIENYIDLTHLTLYVISFNGDEEDLPEVYENLNTNGTSLSKYDVFNATWVNYKLTLSEEKNKKIAAMKDEILQKVKSYYISKTGDGEISVENFSEDEITKSRIINISEFARAIGAIVAKRMPALISPKDQKAQNEIGFGILGIATDIDNKNLIKVGEKVDILQRNFIEIVEKIYKITSKLNSVFSQLTIQKISFGTRANSATNEYSTGLTSSFKVLSYFASLWNLEDKDLKKSIKNIPAYYVFDSLRGVWSAHGDQRLQNYYSSFSNNRRDYLKPVAEEEFSKAFSNWEKDINTIHRNFSKEIKALITIHSNLTYLSQPTFSAEGFEYEHIISKKKVLQSDTNLKKIHLSALGNGMFLPRSVNDEKQSDNLYEAGLKDKYGDLIENSEYFSEPEFSTIDEALKKRNFTKINDMIDRRGRIIEDIIVRQLIEAKEL